MRPQNAPETFQSAREVMDNPRLNIERHTRRTTGEMLRKERVIPKMIDRIKTLFQDVAPLETATGLRDTDELDDAGTEDFYLAEGSEE